MKPAPHALAVLLLVLFPVGAAVAGNDDSDGNHLHTSCCSPPARWAARHDTRDARIAIKTSDRDAVLLLTDEVVALQLSDRTMREVRRKLRDEEDSDEDNALARAIKVAVMSGVRALLDHSAECPVRELSDVQYRHGRLILISEDGDRIFDDVNVNDHDVLSGFSERDALAFVREFRRLKALRGR